MSGKTPDTPSWLVLLALAAGCVWGCGSRSAKPSDMGFLDAALSDLPQLPDGLVPDVPVQVPDGPSIDVPTIDVAVPDSFVPPDTAPPPDTVPQPDVDPGTSAWSVMLASTPGVLSDLWGTGASDLFAVGKGGLIMRYDGSAWSKMTSPTNADLEGIWGNSGSDIFAVGKGGDIYFDGTAWKSGSSFSSYTFHDVWLAIGGSNVFAVGAGPQLRYKPVSNPMGYWSSVSLYSLTQQPLNAIWGLFESEIYVVGDSGTILQCIGTCTGYGSTGWKLMTSGTTYHLQDLYGFSSKSIFAVGLNGTILRYDGSSWSKMQVNTATYFYGVWGSSPSDVYAVGHPIFNADESIFHYDGSSWKKLPPPKTSYLNAVWGTSKTDVVAVGNYNILKLK